MIPIRHKYFTASAHTHAHPHASVCQQESNEENVITTDSI